MGSGPFHMEQVLAVS